MFGPAPKLFYTVQHKKPYYGHQEYQRYIEGNNESSCNATVNMLTVNLTFNIVTRVACMWSVCDHES